MSTPPRWHLGSIRSLLFFPAHRPEMAERARASGADAVVWNCDDGVPYEHRERATQIALEQAKPRDWIRAQLHHIHRPRPDLVYLAPRFYPHDTESWIRKIGDGVLVPIVEHNQAIRDLGDILHSRLFHGIVFGAADYSMEVGRTPWSPLVTDIQSFVGALASRWGLPCWGPPEILLGSLSTYDHYRWQYDYGYTGGCAVHPDQVPIIHRAFAPDAREVEWARHIVKHAPKEPGGTSRTPVEDHRWSGSWMVADPILQLARGIIDRHRRWSPQEPETESGS